jgi:hypothetical protein
MPGAVGTCFQGMKIMKLQAAKILLLTLSVGMACAAAAAGNDAQPAIFLKTLPDGSVELNNQAGDEKAEKLAIEVPVGGAAQQADTAAAPAPVPTRAPAVEPIAWHGSIPAAQVKDPQLADTLSKIGTAQLASGNPALGRRYLMVDKATYMKQQGAN